MDVGLRLRRSIGAPIGRNSGLLSISKGDVSAENSCKPNTPDRSLPFLVVIGASAGGVGTLLDLAARLPRGFPAVVAMALHVGKQPSILPELLSHQSRVLREREMLLRRLASVVEATGDAARAEDGRREADRVRRSRWASRSS